MTKSKSSAACSYIEGLRIAGYRSFGIQKEQTLAPFKQMNLFVGQNNCGKSNVLKLINDDLRWFVNGASTRAMPHFPDSVRYGRSRSNGLSICLGFSQQTLEMFDIQFVGGRTDLNARLIPALVNSPLAVDGLIFIPVFTREEDGKNCLERYANKCRIADSQEWRSLATAWSHVNNSTMKTASTEILSALVQAISGKQIPNVHYISHERMISKVVINYNEFPHDIWDGKATITQLAMLQNPGSESSTSEELEAMRGKFDRLTRFLQAVLENDTARLQTNFQRTTILVDLDKRVDSLDSFGAGIHQLIMIAIATTYHDGQIFCIEEPETNLHPSLQRKLLKYLVDETDNQYFITTHSASLIDAVDDAAVFHLVHDGEQTIVTGMLSKKDQRQICEDLGFRASDLVQTNCMIWVEGPSDRIYINKLISILDDSLSEGKHYSFGFYGGACRAHLALLDDGEDIENDKAWNDFVDLLAINRNAVMIADSDLVNQSETQTNASKLRLEQEFKRYAPNSWYWQTEGREIENYVKESVFIDARGLKEKYRSDKEMPEAEFLNRKVTRRQSSKGVDTSIDKVTVARKVCESDQPFEETTNARSQGQSLVDKIRSWNGLECKQW